MEPDKRQFVRKRTDQLLYAEFGPDNGSILLNLCKDGCSFQSIAPVREEQLHFWVSVGDGRKLEGEGKMVWVDTTKKTGGIRFLNPSAELQEQVYVWLKETLVTTDGKIDPGAVESEAKRRRRELREKARANARFSWKEEPFRAVPSRPAGPNEKQTPTRKSASGATETQAPTPPIISGGWPDESKALRRTGRGSKWGLSTLVVIGLLFLAVISYRREMGHWVMSVGSSLAGEEKTPDATVGGSPEATAGPAEVSPVPVSEAPRPEGQVAVVSEVRDAKESDTELAAGNLEQVASAAPAPEPIPISKRNIQPVSLGVDVATLWTSVENGDTRAEVTLADRYVRGNGVPQSCAQARVLLEAAVKRGNAEARQRLDELPQSGCP